jgi:hypothetical protein
MAAPVRWGARFETDVAQTVFEGHYFAGNGRAYDVSRDGERFLMIDANPSAEAQAAPSAFVAVSNWTSGLDP